jgi:predicted aldo/keto reductase-like oxidoreductase
MKRRGFIRTVAASTAWLASGGWPDVDRVLAAMPPLPKRALGKTGLQLSTIGFSGLVARDNTLQDIDRAVGESRDLGVNYFDIAFSYGNSEEKLAPVLSPIRDKILLTSKSRKRSAEEARAEFEKSCEIMKTDWFDLYLVHGIQDVEKDVDAAFAKGGAMEFFQEMKKSGQIRHLGFSAHSTEAALKAMDLYDFEFLYFPISYVSFYQGDFGPQVLARAKEKGIPVVCLKALARQHWPEDIPKEERCKGCWYQPIEDAEEASLALRWALSQGTVSILPPGNPEMYRRTLALASNLAPITEEEAERLKSLSEDKKPLFPR